jgi:hypothetical protein
MLAVNLPLQEEDMRSPLRATCKGSTRPPFSPITVATRLAAPSSTRKMTQPPPPAPQALAARPPSRAGAPKKN